MNKATAQKTQQIAKPSSSAQDILQRKCDCGNHTIAGGECTVCGKGNKALQRKANNQSSSLEVPPIVHEVLNSPGQLLNEETRAFMEPRFGHDFAHVPVHLAVAPAPRLTIGRADDQFEQAADLVSQRALSGVNPPVSGGGADFGQVRIHTGVRAAEAARAVGARAFTVARNIVFGASEYQPHNSEGRRLLAHELAHVLQQTGHPEMFGGVIRRKLVTGAIDIDTPVLPMPATGDQKADATDLGLSTKKPEGEEEKPGAGAEVDANVLAPADSGKDTARKRDETETGTQDKQAKIGAPAVAPKGGVPEKDEGREAEIGKEAEPQTVADVATGNLALIDEELAEHQRWGAATELVGVAGSGERAKFIAQAAAGGAESGLTEGLFQGAKMGAGIKVAEKVIEKGIAKGAVALAARLGTQVGKFTPLPGVGAAIGGALAAYDLASRDWKATGEAIGRFGKGASIYDQLANDIEAISNVLEVATQVLNVIAGILGFITVVMWIISIVTAGAMSPVAGLLTTISLAIGVATMVLDGINALVLKKLIMMFRALHAFTSEADPRDVVTQGNAIGQAAGAATGFVGGLVGGMAGGGLAEKGVKIAKGKPSTPVPDHPTPPTASGDGPTVKAEPLESGTVNKETATTATAHAQPGSMHPSTETPAALPAPATTVEPQQLVLPGMEAPTLKVQPTSSAIGTTAPPAVQSTSTGGALRPITAPLRLAAPGNEPIPQGLQHGAIGTYGRAVATPHPFALESNPPGAPGATSGGGRMPATGRKQAGVYLEHQTPASVAHEVLPGHEYHGPQGQRRGGRDTLEALTISFPESAKPFKDPLDAALLAEVRARKAQGESVPPIEVIVRGAEHSQAATAQPGGTVPPQQISKAFLAEVDQFQTPRFGYIEVPPDVPLPAGHPLRDISTAEINAHFDRLFHPYTAPSSTQLPLPGMEHLAPKVSRPQPQQLVLPGMDQPATNPNQLNLFSQPPNKPPETLPALQPAPTVQPMPTPQPAPAAQPIPTPQPKPVPQPSLAQIPGQYPDVSHLLQSARAGVHAIDKAKERESDLNRDMPELSHMDRGPISDTEKGLFIAGGTALLGGGIGTAAALASLQGYEKARREPIVEHINPSYPEPPCTPQAIVDIQNQILQTLDARAEAEATSKAMTKQEAHHKANEKPLDNMQTGTEEAISATEAHKQAVARRTEANKQKKENEDKTSNTLADYSNRAAELSTITVPMRAFSRFASLAYSLPESLPKLIADTMPDSVATRADQGLKNGKRNLIKMHTDSQKFLGQLESMDKTINAQKAGQGEQEKKTQADADTLNKTDNKAKESDETLNKAKQTNEDLTNQNKDRLDQAGQLRTEANQTAATLDNQAQQKKTQAQSLAAALQAWAQNHKQARLDALDQTKKRLEQQGYKVTEVKER